MVTILCSGTYCRLGRAGVYTCTVGCWGVPNADAHSSCSIGSMNICMEGTEEAARARYNVVYLSSIYYKCDILGFNLFKPDGLPKKE